MTRPDVIFADEPTGNLDSRSSEHVLRFLQRSVRELSQTIDGAAGVEPRSVIYIDANGPGSYVYLTGANVPSVSTLVDAQEMTTGRLPEQAGEIAVSEWAATQLRVESGDTTAFQVPSDTVSATPESRAFTVTGIYGGEGQFGGDDVSVYLMPDDLAIWNVTPGYFTVFVIAEPRVARERLRQAVSDAVGTGATVTTADHQVALALAEREEETRTLTLGILAFALVTLGILISMSGSQQMGVLIGLVGGLSASLGILAGAVFIVPPGMQLLGLFACRLGGVPGRISAANSQHNPRRTTATAVALLIGVTLVTMMSVGAATLRATFTEEIDATAPVDIEVSLVSSGTGSGEGDGTGLPPGFTQAADAIEGSERWPA